MYNFMLFAGITNDILGTDVNALGKVIQGECGHWARGASSWSTLQEPRLRCRSTLCTAVRMVANSLPLSS